MESSQRERFREIERLTREATALCQEAYSAPEQDLTIDPIVTSPIAWTRALLRSRAKLRETLSSDLLADPAFEIMLDLFASEEEGTKVSVSAACMTSGVPPTTALRWIALLGTRGLIERHKDFRDARRIYLTLRPNARAMIAKWVAETAKSLGQRS